MNSFVEELELKINSLSINFINTLRENDSLIHFIRNFIINIICERRNIEFDFEDCNKSFCKNNNIKDKEQFFKYLKVKGMKIDDHKRNLINSQKVLIIAKDNFAKKAKINFLKNKDLLNLYTYEFIEFYDSDLAHEIFFQFESKETSFKEFCKNYQNDSTRVKSFGTRGPMDLVKTNQIIREKILQLSPNEIIPPFKIDNLWFIVILNYKQEVKFDELIESKMVLSLFDEWINALTVNSIQKFLND